MRYSEKDLKIQELAREIIYMKKEFELKEKELHCEHEKWQLDQKVQVAKLVEESGHLKVRLKESPSKLLQDILKALTVKIPTLNIESLSVSAEKK